MTKLYGTLAEFDSVDGLVRAARRAAEEGYSRLDAYSPFPIDELNEVIQKPNRLPLAVLLGGITGGSAAYLLQTYIAVWDYPINVGGRPLYSWPAFVVITFELTILFASATAFFGTLLFSGLPSPYHPLMQSDAFSLASRDRFFLCIEANDPMFTRDKARSFLQSLHPERVEEIEA